MTRLLLFALFALVVLPAAAQSAADFASGCADDNGADRCTPEAVKAWRDKYGLPSIEQMTGEGTVVRRVLYVDGYGRDLMALSAIRAKNAAPVIEIRLPREGTDEPVIRTRPISATLWERLLADSAAAHRRYQPEAGGDVDALPICRHAWVSRFEAGDPRRLAQYVVAQQWEDAETRAATASACTDGPTNDFAAALARTAAEELAECSGLNLAGQRNWVTLLDTCLRLSGDTISAGQVLAAQRELHRLMFRTRKSNESWTDILRGDFTLASETLRSSRRIDWEAMQALFAGAENLYFRPQSTHGIDSQQVRMTGKIDWSTSPRSAGTKPHHHSRKLALSWVLETGSWVVNDVELLD